MKNLLACLAILAAFNVTAQVDGFQLPYNPDSEPDGYIGVGDVLELLAMFGAEFSTAILNSDSTSAIVEAPFSNNHNGPNRSIHGCRAYCKSLPGNWRATTISDIEEHWEVFPTSISTSVWINDLQNPFESRFLYLEHPDQCDQPGTSCTRPYVGFTNSSINPKCYCATQERPKVEYTMCHEGSKSALLNCTSLLTAQGWLPLGPVSYDGNAGYQFAQAFWRWAD